MWAALITSSFPFSSRHERAARPQSFVILPQFLRFRVAFTPEGRSLPSPTGIEREEECERGTAERSEPRQSDERSGDRLVPALLSSFVGCLRSRLILSPIRLSHLVSPAPLLLTSSAPQGAPRRRRRGEDDGTRSG